MTMTNMKTTEIIIYGASDDLVEVEGDIEGADEYNTDNLNGIISFGGEELHIRVAFCPPNFPPGDLEWQIAVYALNSYPSWPFHFSQRPDREGDPALHVIVPEGAVFKVVDED